MENAGAVAPTHLPQEDEQEPPELEDTPPEPPIVYVNPQAEMLEEAAREGATFCEI